MSPLPFLFKQQLEYYTSHFAQPLPSFSKKPTKQENKLKPKNPTKPANKKNPHKQLKQPWPFSQNYTLLLPLSLLFLPNSTP